MQSVTFREYPRFGLNVSESTVVGSVIAHLVAEDGDVEQAGAVTYYISAGNVDATFGIDMYSGQLILVQVCVLI